MPETQVRSVGAAADSTARTTYDLDTIGIEFEYPLAWNDSDAPATEARESEALRREYGYNPWTLPENESEIPTGTMTGDHVGAEITSDRLNLHTTQPEVWHYRTIQQAEAMGYPFAACGYGETIFGQHLHLSRLPREKARAIFRLSREDWFRAFVCSSVRPNSLDPWRHGGVGSSAMNDSYTWDGRGIINERYQGDDHYEWRLPEPMLPEHFGMVMHFLRLLETDGVESARQYAHDRVHDADDRLTAVQQYRALRERGEIRPEALDDGRRTDSNAAEVFATIVGYDG